jgi:hypothetical protein
VAARAERGARARQALAAAGVPRRDRRAPAGRARPPGLPAGLSLMRASTHDAHRTPRGPTQPCPAARPPLGPCVGRAAGGPRWPRSAAAGRPGQALLGRSLRQALPGRARGSSRRSPEWHPVNAAASRAPSWPCFSPASPRVSGAARRPPSESPCSAPKKDRFSSCKPATVKRSGSLCTVSCTNSRLSSGKRTSRSSASASSSAGGGAWACSHLTAAEYTASSSATLSRSEASSTRAVSAGVLSHAGVAAICSKWRVAADTASAASWLRPCRPATAQKARAVVALRCALIALAAASTRGRICR